MLVVGLDVEIDAAVALIGKAVVQNLLHQLLLLDDMAGGVGLYRWAQHIECVHILVVAVGVVLRYLHGLQLLQACLLCNLVLALVGIVLQVAHIGNVAHIAHLIAQVLQIAEHEVEGDGRTGMAQMGVAIDGGAAHIHAHVGCVERLETLFLSRQGIVDNES